MIFKGYLLSENILQNDWNLIVRGGNLSDAFIHDYVYEFTSSSFAVIMEQLKMPEANYDLIAKAI